MILRIPRDCLKIIVLTLYQLCIMLGSWKANILTYETNYSSNVMLE